MISPEVRSLSASLIARAQESPEQRAVVFLAEDGAATQLTAGEFHRAASSYAAAFQRAGIKSGDLIILVLRHSPDLLTAFWGAIYMGAVPSIFPYLTEKLDPGIYLERVSKLVTHAGASAVITFSEFKPSLEDLFSSAKCRILSIEELPPGSADTSYSTSTRSDIAFLQHSSGTTGLQKGVALSHQSVLNQLRNYSQAIELTASDVIVSWLPLYHDMGLIAGFVLPIITGTPLVLLSPFHWVRSPASLFWAIHNYGGTLSWLPNFAYNHSVRSIRSRDLAGLDLSCWRAAINCSEPVRHASHVQFLERFAPYGFQAKALATSYAMAENTFAVTQSQIGRPPTVDWIDRDTLQRDRLARSADPGVNGALPSVSCGLPIRGTEVRIVDQNRQGLPERHVGEVVVQGDCLLSEYFRRPDITSQAIQDGWYYTGDMGYLADGQLYITGRKKDLIIVGGKNIYPQDIEAIANQVPGIYPGRAVAFGVPDERLGTESIVVVGELADTVEPAAAREIENELRRRVAAETEVALADVRLVEKRWLIKTSSGKMARNDNREKYLQARGDR